MKLPARTVLVVFASVLSVSFAVAQSSAGACGHWEGAIQVPDKDLSIVVDLAKNNKGGWIGTISIPLQRIKAFPLANIAVRGNSVNFLLKGIPGDPTFQGTLSSDGKSFSGDFTQGGGTLPFKLTRTGDPRIEAPAKSTAISNQLEGTWEGVLDVNGKQLRLVLKLSNQSDGTAAGGIVSVDQGGVEIPITTITQEASKLNLDIKSISASYSGDLSKEETELIGQWSQGSGTFPLTFKRPAAKGRER